MEIRFYSVDAPYGCFSNFSPHGFTLDGAYWPTSEHYFQAQKFKGAKDVEEIRLARGPMMAARMGRSRSRPLRRDWERVKEDVMRGALEAKFRAHPDLQRILLSTGEALLVEASSKDSYWGCGAEGTGKNRLGLLLMELREKLAKARGSRLPAPPI